jgi:hypothetical protein
MEDKVKKGFILIFLVFVSTLGFAQNGYKDYTWGMSIDQVRAKCSDLSQKQLIRWAAPTYALMYSHYSEFVSTIPNPLGQELGTITNYESQKNEQEFYFLNGKLIAVEISFWQENILDDLKKQYGNVNPVSGFYGNYRYQTASWNKEANRVIVWELNAPLEYVTYIDKNWLTPLLNKTLDAFKKEKSSTRSRLD